MEPVMPAQLEPTLTVLTHALNVKPTAKAASQQMPADHVALATNSIMAPASSLLTPPILVFQKQPKKR